MAEALNVLADLVRGKLAQDLVGADVKHGELTIVVNRPAIAKVLKTLRDDADFRFTILVDLCGADWPEREQRFDVVYHLLSLSQNQRIRVKVTTDEDTPVPSVTGVFSSAGWYEREAWDLYGILFADHPDLRRILTDYGFEGHPLRKDFPLTGFVEVRYDEEQKRVVYEKVKLTQDFRSFDFLSPWEGMTPLLPGDEKATPSQGTAAEAPKKPAETKA
ncbi:MAG: NADH-quinone oxidoreductase subunit C [Candidatus Odyssella sp.]|nr:NADH-quinone oxidoreductase subunit C [Candidatus Odyssella sp.]